eukprot:CAMPEP_0205826454 /NCGR_PEP_ID=MMETSP0206-20130828/28690_1 /ASSEMBLY_ACC=CAM_ASM_000279 /TAXON_ID=36767 /ORGANISM="Euplotes focardii, Strain TN1" /LENGTH=99 /DNA_ID=CAMNT_0053126391 /DNA_START=210 /DNA_END=509 /DNA_ORIENTATION=-
MFASIGGEGLAITNANVVRKLLFTARTRSTAAPVDRDSHGGANGSSRDRNRPAGARQAPGVAPPQALHDLPVADGTVSSMAAAAIVRTATRVSTGGSSD